MSWYEQFSKQSGRRERKEGQETGARAVECIEEIPKDATPQDAFRLTVEVVRITEQTTRKGDPFWFVKCEDGEGLRFDVVVWETQMAHFRGRLVEGVTLPLALRVPAGSYSAFTLA